MRVCDVPWKDLKVGDVVISATGKSGKITDLRSQDDTICIDWDNDQTSVAYHHQLDKVTFVKGD